MNLERRALRQRALPAMKSLEMAQNGAVSGFLRSGKLHSCCIKERVLLDPCCGSGHILAYMFDVLVQIYGAYGISAREAAVSIVKYNIYGLDIDERAAQLAQFSVMMKARQYDRRFFSRDIQPNVYAIEDSNGITSAPLHDMGIGLSSDDYGKAVKQIMQLIDEFHDAKEYGSIINVSEADWDLLRRFAVPRWMSEGGQISFEIHGEIDAAPRLQQLINIGQALSQKYHAVVTNPPYMGIGNMGQHLIDFVKKHYPDSKSDLFAVFIERCMNMTIIGGFQAMIIQQACMFIPSFEKTREKMYGGTISSLLQIGFNSFPELNSKKALAATFVLQNINIPNYEGIFCDLTRKYSRSADKQLVLEEVIKKKKFYYCDKETFKKIPGAPIAYWISDNLIAAFTGNTIKNYGYAGIGMRTGDNQRFLRLWFEVDRPNLLLQCKCKEDQIKSGCKWIPYNKGGDFRKWYGNNSYVVNWANDGAEIKENTRLNYPSLGDNLGWKISNEKYYYHKGITWSGVSLATFSCRCYEEGFIFDSGANGLFSYEEDNRYYLAGLLNSCVGNEIIKILNPTINTGSGTINQVPVLVDDSKKLEVIELVKDCISISKQDWDAFERSWDFKRSPLVPDLQEGLPSGKIEWYFDRWKNECEGRFSQLKSNEEALNRIFINIYGLENELAPEVDEKEVSVERANLNRDIKGLISYAVGCMFGRYSLDEEGVIYAGGAWNQNNSIFSADKDNVIPICEDEYFEDDIEGRFINFIEIVYGREYLEENLNFIAKSLGGTGQAREIIRNYFLNEFYLDHCSTYSVTGSGKRPIYWLFDSGKKNGFKCLIYMHRYQPDTIARIRTDYVHEQQSRYRTAIADLEQRIDSASTGDRVKLSKKLKHLQEQSAEIHDYEEKIHHLADQYISIDLDDGVKANYAKFQDVLAKIK